MRHVLFFVAVSVIGCSDSTPSTTSAPAATPAVAAAPAAPARASAPAPAPAVDPTVFVASDGRFQVKPPVLTAPAMKDQADPNGGSWRQTGWTTADGMFAVQGRTYASPAQAAAETAAFLPTRAKQDISVDRKITVSKLPGRELAWRSGELAIHARFVIDGATVWKVIVGGKHAVPAGGAAFLDSFEMRSLDLDAPAIAEARLYEGASIGPADARVTIAIFQDPVCKYCTDALAALAPAIEAQAGKVRVVFKQFPMPSHTNAALAAEAMLAAHAQGKFEPLHDALVANPRALAREELIKYATAAGLDVARFTQELDAHTYEAAVLADIATAKRLYVTGTPTLFINGKRMRGLHKPEAYAREIDAALHAPVAKL